MRIIGVSRLSFLLMLWATAALAGDAVPAAPGPAADAPPAAVAAEPDPAKGLGDRLKDTVNATQADPSIPDILQALDRNIAAIGRIRESVDAANKAGGTVDKDLIHGIAHEFDTIAKSFADIAGKAPGVFSRRRDAMKSLDDIGNRIGFSIAKARSGIADLNNQNDIIQKALKGGSVSETELAKLQLSKQVNDAIIKDFETAIQSWNAFGAAHGKVVAGLEAQSSQLDVFFHTLNENARLSESAARTMRLADSISNALNELKSMQDMVATINDLQTKMIDSWQDVTKIMEEVDKSLELRMGPGMQPCVFLDGSSFSAPRSSSSAS